MTGTLWKVFRAAAAAWLKKEERYRDISAHTLPFELPNYIEALNQAAHDADIAMSHLQNKWRIVAPVVGYADECLSEEAGERVNWNCLQRAIKPELLDEVISKSEGDSREAIFTATRLGAWREEAPTMPDIRIYAGEAPEMEEVEAMSDEGVAPSADTPPTSNADPAPPSTPAPSPAKRSELANNPLWEGAIEAFKSADWITETTAPDGSPRYQWERKPTQLAYAMGELFGSNYTPWKDIEKLFGRNTNTLRQNYDNVHKAVRPQPWRAEIDKILAEVKKKQ